LFLLKSASGYIGSYTDGYVNANRHISMMLDNRLSIGFALAMFGTLLFSLKSIFIKFLYLEELGADEVLFFRMVISLPIYIMILIWLLRIKKSSATTDTSVYAKVFLLGFIGYYLASLLDLMSLELISAQLERLGLFTYPFMVALLGFFFFKEPLTRRLLFSLVITYAGLWVVMGQEIAMSGQAAIHGTLLVLGSALSFAFYVLFSKRFIRQLGSQLFTCIAMISSCIFGLLHGVIVLDIATLELSFTSWTWLLLLVIFSTVIPSFMMVEAISRIGPAQTGVVGMLGPVFTIALAIFLLDEPFTMQLVLGVVLMMLGVSALFKDQAK
jgi:drug/metabolite transporter (DMT)-like permease